MARDDGFSALMLRFDTRNKYDKVKAQLEKQMGFDMTHSQVIEHLCNQILSDSISK